MCVIHYISISLSSQYISCITVSTSPLLQYDYQSTNTHSKYSTFRSATCRRWQHPWGKERLWPIKILSRKSSKNRENGRRRNESGRNVRRVEEKECNIVGEIRSVMPVTVLQNQWQWIARTKTWQYSVTRHNSLQCSTVQYSSVQYSEVVWLKKYCITSWKYVQASLHPSGLLLTAPMG